MGKHCQVVYYTIFDSLTILVVNLLTYTGPCLHFALITRELVDFLFYLFFPLCFIVKYCFLQNRVSSVTSLSSLVVVTITLATVSMPGVYTAAPAVSDKPNILVFYAVYN